MSYYNKPHDRDSERSRPERTDSWADRDRPKDRERDRYYNRYNQQKRYGSPEYDQGSAFRRPDGSDYYGYRNSYRSGDRDRPNERQNDRGPSDRQSDRPSDRGPSDRDRNDRGDRMGNGRRKPHYDSYQGSKYRPSKNKPYNGRNPNSQAEGESSSGDRRAGNRSDWDSSYKRHPSQRYAVRDHYKPERRSSERPSSEEHAEQKSLESSSTKPVETKEDTSKKEDQEEPETGPEVTKEKGDGTSRDEPKQGINKEVSSENAGTGAGSGTEKVDSPTPAIQSKSVTEPDTQKDKVTETQKVETEIQKTESEKVDPESQKKVENEPLKVENETKVESETPKVDEKLSHLFDDDPAAKNQSSDDDAPAADTSVLSPVGAAPSDFNFAASLAQEPELKEEPSDTETVIGDQPVDMTKARSLLRKKGADPERRTLKRALVYSSEDEDEPAPKKAIKAEPAKSREQSNEPSAASTPGQTPDPAKDEDHDDRMQVDEEPKEPKHRTQKSYKIKRDSTGRSQLQRACKKGDLEEVKKLIEKGADPNESDFGGFTCLHEAALAGHTGIVKFLIQSGADVNKQALEAGDFETPLMDAAENKHLETVKVLLQSGADPNICNTDGYSTVTKLYHLQEDDDDYEGIIKLLNSYVSPQGDSELSKVSHSPRTVMQDPSEEYFLDLVKKKSNSMIYKYAAQGLKESVAEDFVTHTFTLKKMPDILNLAARNGHVELVDILLGLNPGSFDINQKNKIGVTALLASVGRGYYDVVKFLLSKGADPKITRDKDGLNALEIAKHAALYDPREVVILEETIHGKLDLKKPQDKEAVKQADTKVDNKLIETPKESPAASKEAAKETDPNEMQIDTPEPPAVEDSAAKEEKPALSVKTPVPAEDDDYKSDSRDAHTPVTPIEGSRSPAPAVSPTAAPLTKAQEEQRAKALEQAKIWQEKVQAKKKARKEMFLLAEKEKERKRKEEEERRIEEMKRKEIEKKEEHLRKAEEAKRMAAEAVKKKELIMAQFIREHYPIGLSEAVFDGNIDSEERMKYSPLYVFDVDGKSWVVDVQVALLLATPVVHVHEDMKATSKVEIDIQTKAKLWTLFSSMLGVGRNNAVDKYGAKKFNGLQLQFLPVDEVAEYVKRVQPEAYKFLWEEKRVTRVTLESLEAGRTIVQMNGSPKQKENAECGFVPPKWKNRRDVLRTIHAANNPLW